MRLPGIFLILLLLASPPAWAGTVEMGAPVVMQLPAVAETAQGPVGSTATVTITVAQEGAGHIFLDTFPLAALDMQGSARVAVRVGAQLTGASWQSHDFFFVVRSGAPLVSGPSAGATFAVGVAAALNGWQVRSDVLMTGMVSPDGSIGPVGGVPEKAQAASHVGATRFLFPAGQEAFRLENETVDLASWCQRTLVIECIPVVDVAQAVGLMTDHQIVRPPIDPDATDEEYRRHLTPLSAELLDHSRMRLGEAETAVEALPPQGQAGWRGGLDAARGLLERAERARENGTHYTAASLAYQATVESRFVRDGARLTSPDNATRMDDILQAAADAVERARVAVDGAHVRDTMSFETVGAAQSRLHEAERGLAAATIVGENARTADEALLAVQHAGTAAERAETVLWWLRIGETMPRGADVDAAALRVTARDTISASREAVTYVDAVLRSAGILDGVADAQTKLLEAEAAHERGHHAGAILQAIEAEVQAGVLLEIITFGGDIPAAKFERSRAEAARAIAEARSRGVEPLLAQSQYEFALSLELPSQRLTYLGLARVTANLAGLPTLLGGEMPVETRFQGLPPARGAPAAWVPAAFAIGLAVGVGTGITALWRREDDALEEPEEDVSR